MVFISITFLLTHSCSQNKVSSQQFPNPLGSVNDFEDIYTKNEERTMDSLLNSHYLKTNVHIVLVTLDSSYTSKDSFDKYTLSLANYWGVGEKEKSNGILIAISTSCRKIRIHNGNGIIKRLPDNQTKLIIDTKIIPEFKENKFFNGTINGIKSIIEHLEKN